MSPQRRQLLAFPLALEERDGLRAALKKSGLPFDDVASPKLRFWRFEREDAPVGFGGLDLHGEVGLLRSLVTLPPLRGQGWGRAITALLEVEAIALGCRTLYLLTVDQARFFAHQGYEACRREDTPEAIRNTTMFKTHCPDSAIVMAKRLTPR